MMLVFIKGGRKGDQFSQLLYFYFYKFEFIFVQTWQKAKSSQSCLEASLPEARKKVNKCNKVLTHAPGWLYFLQKANYYRKETYQSTGRLIPVLLYSYT